MKGYRNSRFIQFFLVFMLLMPGVTTSISTAEESSEYLQNLAWQAGNAWLNCLRTRTLYGLLDSNNSASFVREAKGAGYDAISMLVESAATNLIHKKVARSCNLTQRYQHILLGWGIGFLFDGIKFYYHIKKQKIKDTSGWLRYFILSRFLPRFVQTRTVDCVYKAGTKMLPSPPGFIKNNGIINWLADQFSEDVSGVSRNYLHNLYRLVLSS